MFCPDLASTHYSTKTLDWLTQQNIPFVLENDNPPQARPIEDFWAVLKREVYKKGWGVEDEQQLIGRIKTKLKKMDISVCQSMIAKIPKILRNIEDNGPLNGL